jgi:uncharacterized protein YlzI (FlbEa/FlbD family)
MIVLTTLKGQHLAINETLIERVEDDHETRVILTTGARYIVAEPLAEVVRRCRVHEAQVRALAGEMVGDGRETGAREGAASLSTDGAELRLVHLEDHGDDARGDP